MVDLTGARNAKLEAPRAGSLKHSVAIAHGHHAVYVQYNEYVQPEAEVSLIRWQQTCQATPLPKRRADSRSSSWYHPK